MDYAVFARDGQEQEPRKSVYSKWLNRGQLTLNKTVWIADKFSYASMIQEWSTLQTWWQSMSPFIRSPFPELNWSRNKNAVNLTMTVSTEKTKLAGSIPRRMHKLTHQGAARSRGRSLPSTIALISGGPRSSAPRRSRTAHARALCRSRDVRSRSLQTTRR